MTEHESELTALAFVAHVLKPIKLVVWGEYAVSYLGSRAVHGVRTLCFLFLPIVLLGFF